MDDGLGLGEIGRPDLSAEMVAAAEGDVKAQLLVKEVILLLVGQWAHAEGRENAKAQFGDIAVGGLILDELGLAPADRALA